MSRGFYKKHLCGLLTVSLFLCAELTAQVRHDTFIHLTTGDSLDATYFVPVTSPPANGYPGIAFVHGFGLDKYSIVASCSLFAVAGNLSLCFSVRGHGASSGTSTIMAQRERADFGEVLPWFRSLPGIDSGSIGITGGSQGGLHCLWASADRMPVKAVSADVIVPSWASDMLMNGSIRRTAILLMNTNTVRYDASRDTLWEFVRTDNYDSLYAHFVAGRDVDTAQLNSSLTPTMLFLKWQDHYFEPQNGIETMMRYAGPKKLYVGTRGHFSDLVESERSYQNDQLSRWLSHYLRGVANGIDTEHVYAYAYSSLPMDTSGFFTWTRDVTDTWPPAGVNPVRFYLQPDSLLSIVPQTGAEDSLTLHNDYLNPAYTFDTGYIEGFRGPSFAAALPKKTLVFTSPPLGNDVRWIGAPRMHLFIKSGDAKFPIHAQIYEVDSAGNKYFVNRINNTVRTWNPGAAGVLDAAGIPHAHNFQRGNRIRIELTNIDVTNRILLGTFPFVLPTFAQGAVTVYMDAGHQSYIELPAVGTPTGVRGEERMLPASTFLYQNYPNPFNPSTTFSFQLASREFVTLKVFDVLGRECATVVNETRLPGSQSAIFDARTLASGIYFYRLQAGGTVLVRKMLLIR